MNFKLIIPPGDAPYYINPHGYINPDILFLGALAVLALTVFICSLCTKNKTPK